MYADTRANISSGGGGGHVPAARSAADFSRSSISARNPMFSISSRRWRAARLDQDRVRDFLLGRHGTGLLRRRRHADGLATMLAVAGHRATRREQSAQHVADFWYAWRIRRAPPAAR